MTKKNGKARFVPENPDDAAQVEVAEQMNVWTDDLRRVHGREVTQAEMTLLEQALQLVFRQCAVERQIAKEGPTVQGSTGQTKLHPLLKLERELRDEIKDVFARLGLVGETAA